ncbi:glycerate kinase [Evansella sp. AB-rgal1]|uniref:glycerate kinase n=1 Tax=Evansella sp. AB-rgal1 TaxID=3242696 RepID=UPI00359CEBDE
MKRKIIIAPDSFKECMTAQEAAKAIERGFRSVFQNEIDIELIPMADGGEGTTQSLGDALSGRFHKQVVTGPLGEPVEATFALSDDKTTAIIEMAEASGLALVPREKRNPLIATTYGTGELIRATLDHGVRKIIIGIGGSATNDGGAGMMEALGGVFSDSNGSWLPRGGGALKNLAQLDLSNLDPRLKEVEILVACDVDNPLLGKNGASTIYGPQKGATESMIEELDEALSQYNDVLVKVTGKNVKDVPGAGAAGGLGTGLMACLNATLEPGVDIVLKETNFRERAKDADLVITGEGRIDNQTIHGKTPIGVARAAKEMGVKVIALCGTLGKGYEVVHEHGIDAAFSIVQGPCELQEAIRNGSTYLELLARNVAMVWKLGECN